MALSGWMGDGIEGSRILCGGVRSRRRAGRRNDGMTFGVLWSHDLMES